MKEWEKNVRQATPYVPGEQPVRENIIKLNTNENPYPPSPKVVEAQIVKEDYFQENGGVIFPNPEPLPVCVLVMRLEVRSSSGI